VFLIFVDIVYMLNLQAPKWITGVGLADASVTLQGQVVCSN